MPDIHFDPIYVVMILVLGAGLCIGWVLRAVLAPPLADRREELPFVQITNPMRSADEVLAEHQQRAAQRPAAPTAPRFEEDAFFARPEGRPEDEIERASASVISMTQRPLAGTRAMG